MATRPPTPKLNNHDLVPSKALADGNGRSACRRQSECETGGATGKFERKRSAKVVSLKRHRPEGETQLKENGRFDSQHAAAEASEVLRDIDELDPIIVAMPYLGVPEEMSVQDHPATWQMTIKRSFSRMRSEGSRFTLGVWGLKVCSLDVAFMFATVRSRSQPSAAVRAIPIWPCLW